jgi:hypothetical protein
MYQAILMNLIKVWQGNWQTETKPLGYNNMEIDTETEP